MPAWAQLDTATLCIRWDYGSLTRPNGYPQRFDFSAPDHKLHANLFYLDDSSCSEYLCQIDDYEQRLRSGFLCAMQWHEQRHFVDFVLTNFGASRVRAYLEMYSSFDHLLGALCDVGPDVGFPLSVYGDEVRRSRLGAREPSERLADIARYVKLRATFFDGDHYELRGPSGSVYFGGPAQLEALAFYAQFGVTQSVFGLNFAREVWHRTPSSSRSAPINRSIESLFRIFGIEFITETSSGDFLDVRFIHALLLGSLFCTRKDSSTEMDEHEMARYSPSRRLLKLLEFFHAAGFAGRVERPLEAWERVEDASLKLWGRTCTEEMQEDVKFEGEFLQEVVKRDQTRSYALDVFRDFHRMRCLLLNCLIEDPSSVVEPSRYYEETRLKVRPSQVLCFRSPLSGDLDAQSVLFWSLDMFGEPSASALLVDRCPDEGTIADNFIEPVCKESWKLVTLKMAPLARLSQSGRRVRSLLDREILEAEGHLQQLGLKPMYEPLYRYPITDRSAALYFEMVNLDTMNCDFTGEELVSEQAILISSWDFVAFRRLRDHAILGRRSANIIRDMQNGEFGLWMTHRRYWELVQ